MRQSRLGRSMAVASAMMVLMASGVFAAGTEERAGAEGIVVNESGLPIVSGSLSYDVAVKLDSGSPVEWADKKTANAFMEETNITFNWQDIPESGWDEKVSLLFASGDLPDIVWGGISDIVVVKNTEAMLPINDLIDDRMPALRAFLDTRRDIEDAITAPDGNIYGFFYLSEYIDDLIRPKLLVNTTWLERVGRDIPETTGEFQELLRAFATDVNGNGERDEIPFSFAMVGDESYDIDALFGAFGVFENRNHLMVEDGDVLFSPAQEGYFQALTYFHELYSEGLIDQNAFVHTEDQYRAKSKGGEPIYGVTMVGIAEGVVDPEYAPDYVAIPPMAGPNGDRMWWVTDVVPVGLQKNVVVLNRDIKHPEAMARFVDYIVSDEANTLRWSYGEKGIMWDYEDDGRVIAKLSDHLPEDMGYGKYKRTFTGISPFIKDFCVNRRLANTPANLRRDEHIRKYMPFIPEQFVTTTAFEEPDRLTERAAILTDIQTYMRSFKARAITEGIDRATWESHLANLGDLRVDRYLELMQDYYDRNQLESGARMDESRCPSPVSRW